MAVRGHDQAIHPDQQRFYAERMGATTIELEASQSIMISRAGDVAVLIRSALGTLA